MPDISCPTCRALVPEAALFCPQCGTRTGRGDSTVMPGPGDEVPSRLSRALTEKYQVRRLLGEGGFAQVYEVWDTDLQRRLAVKVLKPDIAWSAGMLERFRQECRSLARLTHPNILAIHFVGEGEGLVYYAMPFIEGESLSSLLRQGALSLDRAIAILRPLLDALAHAHGQGLIHRDIKPDNIMLESSTGRPLLVDFGIAKRLDGAGHQTQQGFVVGTPQYMSPEQALGQGDVDARSDIYAVGAVLFQMVTGTPPFEGETSQEIVGKHLSEPAPIASSRNARIPMWLSEIIVRCLAKRPAERFQSAAMLLDAINLGRESGATEAVSAERVAQRVQAEMKTELMSSAERASTVSGAAAAVSGPRASGRVSSPRSPAPAAPAPAAASTRAVTPPAPARKRWLLPVLLLLLLGAAAGAWVVLGGSPVLVIENHLVEPIRLVVENRTVEVAASASSEIPVSRKGPLVVQWYLVRPTGPGNTPLGVEVQGSITEQKPGGRMPHVIDAGSSETAVFAPLVTNATAEPLGVIVNAGLVNAMPCNCRVNPGATRTRIGYYPLFKNSTVQASSPVGTVATFRDLGEKVDRQTGAVGLRFEAKDFGVQ
ncbi:MAG TPA: protein kinase [Gemmatimonadales bacterium]|nr:protein kinase [Gemmatimonadales bacterium]